MHYIEGVFIMKKFLSVFVGCISVLAVDAAFGATGRVGVQPNTASSPRMPTMAVSTVGVTTSVSNLKNKVEVPDVKPDDKPDVKPDDKPDDKPDVKPDDKPDDKPSKDMREKEREACIRNNIGIGNTFVWASRFSDISNYATMVEDVENPENNTCFVLVGVRSADSRVDLSDLPSKYFEMGRNISCASWVDEDEIESRILDAKKKNRTLATIGGAVGGAALGVGSMELFGNKLIGGSVMGQKEGTTQEQFYTYMYNLDSNEYNEIVSYFIQMDEACSQWKPEYGDKPKDCDGLRLSDDTVVSYNKLAGDFKLK